MQRQAGGIAGIRQLTAICLDGVYLLAADKVPRLGEVDADLVGATGLQLTDQGRVVRQSLVHADMRDGKFSTALGAAAAPAVPAITDQVALDRLGLHVPRDDRDVTAGDRVFLELPAQLALATNAAGKNHQAAGVFVESLDDAQPRQIPGFLAKFPADRFLGDILERRGQFPALLGPFEFGRVAHGVEAGDFFNHDHVVVKVPDDDILGSFASHLSDGLRADLDDLARLHPAGMIHAHRTANRHVTPFDQGADRRPGLPGTERANKRGQGLAGHLGADDMGGGLRGRLVGGHADTVQGVGGLMP